MTSPPPIAGRRPVALTIAGSDPSGGAGIQADLKTFSALGAYGASVITALTAQNTQGVQGVLDIPPAFVTQQITSVLDDLTIGAVKVGMLSSAPIIQAVAEGLRRYGIGQVVLDPVMISTSGHRLLADDAVAALAGELLPLALIVTPNLPEAAVLAGGPVAQDEAAMRAQGERILALGPQAVLIKGGHGEGPESTDLLLQRDGTVTRFSGPRISTRNTHGTGCTLSAAIAVGLARGKPLPQAVADAKAYLGAALAGADALRVGHGHGPVDHLHAYRET